MFAESIQQRRHTQVSLDDGYCFWKFGYTNHGEGIQKRNTPDPASFVGSGKAEEIKDFAQKSEATLLVVDDFMSPTQKSNLQKLTSMTVWDRAFVIMKIFESRAHTAEAKLQVELAHTI